MEGALQRIRSNNGEFRPAISYRNCQKVIETAGCVVVEGTVGCGIGHHIADAVALIEVVVMVMAIEDESHRIASE